MKWVRCLFLLFIQSSVWAAELVLGMPQTAHTADLVRATLIEAYQRLGYSVRFNVLPLERSLYMANRGELDGDAMRATRDFPEYPGLVLVDFPVASVDLVAFGKGRAWHIEGFESIKPYRLVTMRGIKELESLRGYNLIFVNQGESAFKMLNADRTDLVLMTRNAICFAKTLGFADIYVQEPALIKWNFYHHLNRRHAELASKVSAILRQMQKDGSMSRIQADVQKKWDSCPLLD